MGLQRLHSLPRDVYKRQTYWHVDCVRKMSINAFIDHYENWCKRKKYNFSKSKAEEIYGKAKRCV